MNNEEMVKMEAGMKDVFAKARGYNRLIAMISMLSDETLRTMVAEVVASGHTGALAELPSDVIARVLGK